ncbi:MAG: 4Fe-4S dicluster domain-containing protein [Gammaproteobacteria bacterium]|nr:4Fe-4S dicluster domain-containing protein [Gammaproteobacteria bacterium]
MDFRYLPRQDLQLLIDALRQQAYRLLGPVVRQNAIVYDVIESVAELPVGIQDEQSPGSYRLHQVDSPRNFAWANSPQALKPLSFAPRESLWSARRDEHGVLSFEPCLPEPEQIAVIGIRACDLAALDLQDRHFLQQNADPAYERRRESLFLIAVNCSHPAATCFCSHSGDGPSVKTGYDLVMTELDDGYLIASGSLRGKLLLEEFSWAVASAEQRREAELQAQASIEQMQAQAAPDLSATDVLTSRLEHPRWEEVAARCLACGNCTAVCPSCFCHREIDETELGSPTTTHLREWDSCFGQGHSYIHGLTVRSETRLRYRQWLTHKFATWKEQYGRIGCTGCGRCISWCPVGIDVREELAALCEDAAHV